MYEKTLISEQQQQMEIALNRFSVKENTLFGQTKEIKPSN